MQHGEFPGNARQRDPGIRPGHETPCQKGKGTPMLDRITLITGNAGKAAEYAAMLGIEVTPAKAELTEVQALDVAPVAARRPPDPRPPLGEPVLVDDTGLSIHGWNGLPGALVAWFLDTVGPQAS